MTDPTFSPAALRTFLREHGLHLSKRFGQNFLVDRNKVLQIVRLLDLSADDHVVEIGPGIGTVTRLIAPKVRSLTLFEIDHGFCRLLRTLFADTPSVTLVEGDVLRTADAAHFPPGTKVYSSLPYNSAVRILLRLAHFAPSLRLLVVLLPDPIVERLRSGPGLKTYGTSTILFNTYYRFDGPDLRAERRLFYPAPKVDSRILRILPRPLPNPPPPDPFAAFVSSLFQARRKMLRNLLPPESHSLLDRYGLRDSDRPERAPPEFFLDLFRHPLLRREDFFDNPRKTC